MCIALTRTYKGISGWLAPASIPEMRASKGGPLLQLITKSAAVRETESDTPRSLGYTKILHEQGKTLFITKDFCEKILEIFVFQ